MKQDTLRSLLAISPSKPNAKNENIQEILFGGYFVSYAIDAKGEEIYLLDHGHAVFINT